MYDDVYFASFGRKYIYGRLTSHDKKSSTFDLGLTDLQRKQNSCKEFILVTIQDKLNLDTHTTSNDSISLPRGSYAIKSESLLLSVTLSKILNVCERDRRGLSSSLCIPIFLAYYNKPNFRLHVYKLDCLRKVSLHLQRKCLTFTMLQCICAAPSLQYCCLPKTLKVLKNVINFAQSVLCYVMCIVSGNLVVLSVEKFRDAFRVGH